MSRAASRIPALDGLRGVAILLVILHNTNDFPDVKNWTLPFSIVAHAGWTGVQLFFVLSGFLITGALLDSKGSSNYFSSFFARRILRIFPLYFIALTALLVVAPRVFVLDPQILATYGQQPWLWLFLSNWTQPFHGAVYWFPHFWSLAVEEQFYLIWPVAIALTPRKWILGLAAAVMVVAIACRIALLASGTGSEAIYMFTVTRMDALALGAAVAVLARSDAVQSFCRARSPLLLGAAALLLIVSGALSHMFDTHSRGLITAGYTLLALCASLIVLLLASGAGRGLVQLLSLPALRSTGLYSYAMYIIHLPLSLLLNARLSETLEFAGSARPLLSSAVIIVLSYGLGYVSYHAIEKHFLALKRHFEPQCDGFRPLRDQS